MKKLYFAPSQDSLYFEPIKAKNIKELKEFLNEYMNDVLRENHNTETYPVITDKSENQVYMFAWKDVKFDIIIMDMDGNEVN